MVFILLNMFIGINVIRYELVLVPLAKMLKFKKLFNKRSCNVIGMIHLDPLPATPSYENGSFNRIVEKARHEANIYSHSKVDAVLIENMHDIPYMLSSKFGPEIVASMASLTLEIKRIFENTKKMIPIGIQVLACGGKEAIAIAKSSNCQFIRNEGFVFSHIGDEGWIDSNAGELLRYRKSIDAENVLIFNDIKKKHSSHAITQDVTLLETAFAAQFFQADGIILTGKSTGDTTDIEDLKVLHDSRKKLNLPTLIGSGVTKENIKDYISMADALIIGSYFKNDGHWKNDLSSERINDFMNTFEDIITKDLK